MFKKGSIDLTSGQVVLLILLAVLAGVVFISLNQYKHDAKFWEDYYAKEISMIINLAEPGDEISIDVQHMSKIARKNKVVDLDQMIRFDGKENEIIVSLRNDGGTRFSYFNDVIISESREGVRLGDPVNILDFKIVDSGGENE